MTLTDLHEQASHARRELAVTEQRAKDAIADTLRGKTKRDELADVLRTTNAEAHRLRGVLHTLSKQIDVQQAYPVVQGFVWSVPVLLEALETLQATRQRVTTLAMPGEPDHLASGLRTLLRDCEAWLVRHPAPTPVNEQPAAALPARGRRSRDRAAQRADATTAPPMAATGLTPEEIPA